MAEILYSDYEHLTEGEQRTAKKLEELPDNWAVICNKILPRQRNQTSREIDFIVIGDNTVLAIDEKSWKGEIHGTDLIWTRTNGDSERSPLNKVDMVSRILASHISTRTKQFQNPKNYPFAFGAVSLTMQETPPRIDDSRSNLVFLYNNLVQGIQTHDKQVGIPEVGKRRRDIKQLLFNLSTRPKRPRIVNEYSVIDGYDTIGESLSCRAIHAEGTERLLTIFGSTPHDPESTNFYLQEFRTLQKLSKLNVSPQVYDYFRWSDDYLVVPSEIPAGVSYGSIPTPNHSSDLIPELRRAITVFQSLSIIHAEGVIHRALTSDNIFISGSTESPKCTITGFYAARRPNLEGLTIAPRLNHLNINNPFSPPEIRMGYEWAHETSDTYSVSLILLERLSGKPIDKLIRQLPNEAAQLQSELPYLDEYTNTLLHEFFTATLGSDPPTDNHEISTQFQRLSSLECVDMLSELIDHLEEM